MYKVKKSSPVALYSTRPFDVQPRRERRVNVQNMQLCMFKKDPSFPIARLGQTLEVCQTA